MLNTPKLIHTPVNPNIFGRVLSDMIEAIVDITVPMESCIKLPVPIMTPSPMLFVCLFLCCVFWCVFRCVLLEIHIVNQRCMRRDIDREIDIYIKHTIA